MKELKRFAKKFFQVKKGVDVVFFAFPVGVVYTTPEGLKKLKKFRKFTL